MADTLIIVKYRKRHARGQSVSGVALGRCYKVGDDLLLYAMGRTGSVSKTPGCHPDDAAEYAEFSDTFRVTAPAAKKSPAPPPPAPSRAPPPPPMAGGGRTPGADQPDPGPSAGDGSSPAISLPDDHNDLTTQGWVDLAEQHGLATSKELRAIRPKARMVEHLRKLVDERS